MKFKIIMFVLTIAVACIVLIYFSLSTESVHKGSPDIVISQSKTPKLSDLKSRANKLSLLKQIAVPRVASQNTDTESNDDPYINDYVTPDAATIAYKRRRTAALQMTYWDDVITVTEKLFQEDTPDFTRTIYARSTIQQIIADGYPGTDLVECRCGIKLCKVVMTHEDADEYKKFDDGALSENALWTGTAKSGKYAELDNGKIESTFYFSRKDNAEEFHEEIDETMYSMNFRDH